jgi:hypothetical protein
VLCISFVSEVFYPTVKHLIYNKLILLSWGGFFSRMELREYVRELWSILMFVCDWSIWLSWTDFVMLGRDTAVGAATRLWAGWSTNWGLTGQKEIYFFLFHGVWTSSGSHPGYDRMGTGCCFSRGKMAGVWSWHICAEGENVFMLWCSVNYVLFTFFV